MENNNEKISMTPLSKVMQKLTDDGYTLNFSIDENRLKILEDNGKIYLPNQVTISSFYRFEGESDPGDSAILYAIETADGHKGLLTDAYGMYADAQVSKFIRAVENIKKEEHTHKEKEVEK